jgi:WD40 repeat protein
MFTGNPITTIAFSPAGDQLASFCESEGLVRFWSPGTTIFGISARRLLGRSSTTREIPVPKQQGESIGSRMEWKDPKEVLITWRSRRPFKIPVDWSP